MSFGFHNFASTVSVMVIMQVGVQMIVHVCVNNGLLNDFLSV